MSLRAVVQKHHIFAPIYKDSVNIYGSTASIKTVYEATPVSRGWLHFGNYEYCCHHAAWVLNFKLEIPLRAFAFAVALEGGGGGEKWEAERERERGWENNRMCCGMFVAWKCGDLTVLKYCSCTWFVGNLLKLCLMESEMHLWKRKSDMGQGSLLVLRCLIMSVLMCDYGGCSCLV